MDRKRTLKARGAALILVAGLIAGFSFSSQIQSRRPTPQDKCAVCGMFVAEYPNFLAEIVLKNGTHLYFDGPKDMFKYYFEPEKYDSTRRRTDIAALYVTDYYSLDRISGDQAYYVLGSDVRGPMGNELIPLRSETEAKTFFKDHRGKSLVQMKDLTIDLINGLD